MRNPTKRTTITMTMASYTVQHEVCPPRCGALLSVSHRQSVTEKIRVVGPWSSISAIRRGRRQRESHRADGNGGNDLIAPGCSRSPLARAPEREGRKDPDRFGRHGVILSGG
ncbi:MAG: hypothetical protein IPI61_12155 [Syntrophaceae bacterium]|nr:hypothetical protein [Syntrophaceae bacterium]